MMPRVMGHLKTSGTSTSISSSSSGITSGGGQCTVAVLSLLQAIHAPSLYIHFKGPRCNLHNNHTEKKVYAKQCCSMHALLNPSS